VIGREKKGDTQGPAVEADQFHDNQELRHDLLLIKATTKGRRNLNRRINVYKGEGKKKKEK